MPAAGAAHRLRLRAAACGLSLVLVMGACSSSTQAVQPVTLQVVMADDWVTPPYVAAVRDFERAHPGVTVSTTKTPFGLMRDTVQADIANHHAPDVVHYHAFAAAAQGMAQQVDDLWTGHLQPSEFLPGAVEDVTWAGHRYGVPLDSNALLLMYNDNAFQAAHLPLAGAPTTFSEIVRISPALSAADGTRKAFTIPTSDWWTYGWIRANGGEVLSAGPDGKPKITLDDPAVVQALSFLAGLVQRGYAFPPRSAASSSGDALALFQGGQAAMYASGSWDVAPLRSQLAGFHVAAMPAGKPGLPEATALGGSSLFIPKGSTHRELAFEFMLTLTADQYALRFASEQGRLPVRPRLFQNPVFKDADLQVYVQHLSAAHPYTLEAFPPAKQAFQQALDEILRQGHPPAEALARAQATAVAALGTSP